MTPDQRKTASALKWMRILLNETNRIAAGIQELINKPPYKEPPGLINVEALQSRVVDLRKAIKRCAYHGLGETIQPLLIPETKRKEA